MTGFTHPSRPGHHRQSFTAELRDRVALLASALIPASEGYPSGGDAQVATFMEERASRADRLRLEDIVDRFAVTSPENAYAALQQLESGEPLVFAWLRDFIYHGYYASRRVLAVMADRGYGYHGAPQPLGYSIDVEPT